MYSTHLSQTERRTVGYARWRKDVRSLAAEKTT